MTVSTPVSSDWTETTTSAMTDKTKMVKTINETNDEDLLDLDIMYKNVKYAQSVDYDLKKWSNIERLEVMSTTTDHRMNQIRLNAQLFTMEKLAHYLIV